MTRKETYPMKSAAFWDTRARRYAGAASSRALRRAWAKSSGVVPNRWLWRVMAWE